MDERDQRAVDILRELGSRPAVPFFEDGPAHYIQETLCALDLAFQRDAFGNIVTHHGKRSESSNAPIAFVAHMDHPGFEIIEKIEDGFVARALGGVPMASLVGSTSVLALAHDGRRLSAEITPREGSERLVTVRLKSDAALIPPAPVVFDLPDFVLDGDTIRMRALDDLAGCGSILAALERTVSDGAETDMFGVFTRAEEGGLYGARLLAESGMLPKETLIVSVEASAVIPGVAQGEGPVVRTGDASYTFDAEAEQVLTDAARRIKKRLPEFRSQRQLMSGGTCEATAFAVFGYRTTGLAFPLGNYHNATTSISDPDGGVAAEYIRLSDYLGGVDLIAEAATGVSRDDASLIRERLGAVPDDVRRRMMDSAQF